MEEIVGAELIQVGDLIKCICEAGCIKPDGCQNFCKKNPCDTSNEGTWEKVLRIQYQPSVQFTWIYFTLTHNKEFGVWSKQAIIRLKL